MGPITKRDRERERVTRARELAMRLRATEVPATLPGTRPVGREVRPAAIPSVPERPAVFPMATIQAAVCHAYDVSRTDLISWGRSGVAVEARHVAMYLVRLRTLRTMPEIGSAFGGRDSTTVLYAVRKVEARLAADPVFAGRVETIEAALAGVLA